MNLYKPNDVFVISICSEYIIKRKYFHFDSISITEQNEIFFMLGNNIFNGYNFNTYTYNSKLVKIIKGISLFKPYLEEEFKSHYERLFKKTLD